MLRTASFLRCVLLLFALAAVPLSGNAQQTVVGPLMVPAIVATPFSAVGVAVTDRQTADGNHFSHTSTYRFYRDTQGRTRTEREMLLPHLNANGDRAGLPLIEIRDLVASELIILNPRLKTVMTTASVHFHTSEPASTVPRVFAQFGGINIGPNDRGWSAPVSLGAKSIDGLNATGTRQVYTIPAGSKFGNQKVVSITVEQWFSPALGMVLSRNVTASSGGQSSYHLEQIVQAEPDASLFTIPADYRRVSLPMPDMPTGAAAAPANTK